MKSFRTSHQDSSDGEDEQLIDQITRPLRTFAQHRLSGGIVLLCGAVLAMVLANSPWADRYHKVLQTTLSIGIGDAALSKPLLLWVNDGLMGFFFFVVGLEIKREFLAGSLATRRKATLPIVAALGGMVVPALVYYALNPVGLESRGWGIPMATDIAFALGVLALLGDRVRVELKVFLTALAIVDDMGAILVIAIFYTEKIVLVSLVLAAVLLAISICANAIGVSSPVVYFILGTLIWLAFLQSGVHATLAAVLMAFTIPARTRLDGEPMLRRLESLMIAFRAGGVPRGHHLLPTDQHHVVEAMAEALNDARAPLQRLENFLLPVVTFLVLPLFALANAGVSLEGQGQHGGETVATGIVAGLFLGKQVGIFSFSWLAVRAGIADLPPGVSWAQLYGVAVLGGIGFTMSLFVASLAFPDLDLGIEAKRGIMVGSLLSGLVGVAVLLWARPPKPNQIVFTQ